MAWEKNGSWYIEIQRDGVQQSLRFSTQQDAENAEIIRRHAAERRYVRNKIRRDSVINLLRRAKKDGRILESRNLERTVNAMGAWAIRSGSEFTIDAIAQILESWKEPRYAYSTKFLYVKMLKRILHVIGYYDPYFENLRHAMPRLQNPGNRIVVVSDETFERVFRPAPLGYRFVLLTARGAGLRLAEGMSIRPSMIDFGTNLASFTQKGPSDRSQFFAQAIVELAKLCPDQNLRCCDQLMKPLHGEPRVITQDSIRRWLERTIHKLDLPRFCFHDLRRTIATEIHRKTRDLFLLKQFLGHRSITSTVAYVKPFQPQGMSQLIEECQPRFSEKIA